MMSFTIISPKEKELLKAIENSNDSDIFVWRISNVLLPLFTIVFSIGCSIFFKKANGLIWITYLNLLLTGALPMIALNRISGMGVYLFKYDRSKEKKYGIDDTFKLRTKLFVMLFLLVSSTMALYIYQVLNYPFTLGWGILFMLLISVCFIYWSLTISKKVFLLQDKLIDKTFEQEVRDDMVNKGHGKNWDV